MGWDVTLRAALSLLLVLGLIGGAGLLARRIAAHGGLMVRKGTKRRLAVVDSLVVDNRRRLLLIRKDGAEHLLLVGGGCDLVIEQGAAQPAFTLTAPATGEQE
jgi:flagellar protein FliO/FliZ